MNPDLEAEVEGFGPDVTGWLRLFRHYRDGHLWRAGGIGDQPARYLEAMELLGTETARQQRMALERERRKSEAGLGGSGKARLKVHR